MVFIYVFWLCIKVNSSLKSTRSLPVVACGDTKVDNNVNFDVPSWESKQPLQVIANNIMQY